MPCSQSGLLRSNLHNKPINPDIQKRRSFGALLLRPGYGERYVSSADTLLAFKR